jgi:peptidoglycan lytic transglycosylase
MRTAVLALCALTCLESRAQAQLASYYGKELAGRRTASGERFNPGAMTAAHRTLPLGTRVRVTNIHNGRSVIVRINDRGPFVKGRSIDLSSGAARAIGMGTAANVRMEVIRLRGSATSIGQRLARGPLHGYALLAARSIRSQRLSRRMSKGLFRGTTSS